MAAFLALPALFHGRGGPGRLRPVPGLQSGLNRPHFDALGRADLIAFFTAGAGVSEYRVNLPGSAQNRVGGTALETLGAAHAEVFVYECDHGRSLLHSGEVHAHAQFAGQCFGQRPAAGRAQGQRSLSAGYGSRCRCAARIAALAALGAGQQRLDLPFQRIALDRQIFCGDTE